MENITNSEVLAKFCTEKLEISFQNGECKHYQRHFFHIPEIDRQGDTEAKTLQKTQKVHNIRNVGIPDIVEVRDSSCFCTNCRHGTGPCLNQRLVLNWEPKNIISKQKPTSYYNYWNDVYEKIATPTF